MDNGNQVGAGAASVKKTVRVENETPSPTPLPSAFCCCFHRCKQQARVVRAKSYLEPSIFLAQPPSI